MTSDRTCYRCSTRGVVTVMERVDFHDHDGIGKSIDCGGYYHCATCRLMESFVMACRGDEERRLPRSLGLGNDGPTDLSEREESDDGEGEWPDQCALHPVRDETCDWCTMPDPRDASIAARRADPEFRARIERNRSRFRRATERLADG